MVLFQKLLCRFILYVIGAFNCSCPPCLNLKWESIVGRVIISWPHSGSLGVMTCLEWWMLDKMPSSTLKLHWAWEFWTMLVWFFRLKNWVFSELRDKCMSSMIFLLGLLLIVTCICWGSYTSSVTILSLSSSIFYSVRCSLVPNLISCPFSFEPSGLKDTLLCSFETLSIDSWDL